MIDGIQIGFLQIVCLGISDFFGLINRHLSVVGQVIGPVVGQFAVQVAALGIKGHMAEAKKLVSCQVVSKLLMCGVLVFVQADNFPDCHQK